MSSSQHSFKSVLCIIASLFFSMSIQAVPSLRIYTRDNAVGNNNQINMNLKVENVGTEPVSDFHCYYYLTTESGCIPQLDDYYTPYSDLSLEQIDNESYRVKVDFAGTVLQPGQTVPSADGCSFGINCTGWVPMDKSNDFSYIASASFTVNENIPVFVDGNCIYGNQPGSSGGTPVAYIDGKPVWTFNAEVPIAQELVTLWGGLAAAEDTVQKIFDNVNNRLNLRDVFNGHMNYVPRTIIPFTNSNRITNGSFDSDMNGWSSSCAASAFLSWNKMSGRAGDGCVQFKTGSTTPSYGAFSFDLSLPLQRDYRAYGYMKGTLSNLSDTVTLSVYSGTRCLGSVKYPASSIANTWDNQISISFYTSPSSNGIPVNDITLKIAIGNTTHPVSGNIYFDDFCIFDASTHSSIVSESDLHGNDMRVVLNFWDTFDYGTQNNPPHASICNFEGIMLNASTHTYESDILFSSGGITHELAHVLGARDMYAHTVDSKDNPVNNASYHPPQSIMTDDHISPVKWDDWNVDRLNYIHSNNISLSDNDDLWYPDIMSLRIVDDNNTPLPNATVNIYTHWYNVAPYTAPWNGAILPDPILTSTTRQDGIVLLNKNMWYENGEVNHFLLLAVAEYNGMTKYAWFTWDEAQSAFLNSQTNYRKTIVFKPGTLDANGFDILSSSSGNENDNSIAPSITLLNNSTTPVNLNDILIEYYFYDDNPDPALITAGISSVGLNAFISIETLDHIYSSSSDIKANMKAVVSFPGSVDFIPANSQKDVAFTLDKLSGSFEEHDDWSFGAFGNNYHTRNIVIKDASNGSVIYGNDPETEGRLIGDVDKNSVIDQNDAILINTYLSGSAQWDYLTTKAVDLTGDKKISIHDQLLMEKIASGEITSLPSLATIGDIDRNGAVTIDDALLIARYFSNMTTLDPVQLIIGDVDGNGVVDIVDALNINRLLDGVIEELPYSKK